VEVLNNLWAAESRRYHLMKWWSQHVVEIILPLNLAYTNKFSAGQQTAGWLAEKAMAQKNSSRPIRRISSMTARTRKAEEEERKDVAKHRQAVAIASE
jgi:hypothetical protein